MVDLAVVLPGGGYTDLGPAIRLPVLAAQDHGYRPVSVTYPAEALRSRDMAALVTAARTQVEAALADAVGDGGVGRVVIVAKSLGTRVVGGLVDSLSAIDAVAAVWLTPLFGDPDVRRVAIDAGWRSLIAYGDQDPFHDEAGVAEVAGALSATVVQLNEADHALEVPGNVVATADGLRELAVAARDFLAHRPAG